MAVPELAKEEDGRKFGIKDERKGTGRPEK
jgi:hypothetical protein